MDSFQQDHRLNYLPTGLGLLPLPFYVALIWESVPWENLWVVEVLAANLPLLWAVSVGTLVMVTVLLGFFYDVRRRSLNLPQASAAFGAGLMALVAAVTSSNTHSIAEATLVSSVTLIVIVLPLFSSLMIAHRLEDPNVAGTKHPDEHQE